MSQEFFEVSRKKGKRKIYGVSHLASSPNKSTTLPSNKSCQETTEKYEERIVYNKVVQVDHAAKRTQERKYHFNLDCLGKIDKKENKEFCEKRTKESVRKWQKN